MRLAIVLFALGCGGSQGSGPDRCALAMQKGPPSAGLECPSGTTRAVKVERHGARGIPTATGKRTPLEAIATTEWCATDEGLSNGPYLALDNRRRVVRSGQHVNGEPIGAWIAWTARGAPQAITFYDGGTVATESRCR